MLIAGDVGVGTTDPAILSDFGGSDVIQKVVDYLFRYQTKLVDCDCKKDKTVNSINLTS